MTLVVELSLRHIHRVHLVHLMLLLRLLRGRMGRQYQVVLFEGRHFGSRTVTMRTLIHWFSKARVLLLRLSRRLRGVVEALDQGGRVEQPSHHVTLT